MRPVAVDIVTGATPATYTRELVNRLPSTIDHRLLPSNQYASTRLGTAYRLFDHPRSVRRERRPGALLHIDTQLLAYVLAGRQQRPTILTCHDLVPFMEEFDDPSYVSRRRIVDRLYYRALRQGILGATRIMTVSRQVRTELIEFGCPAENIDVAPWGVDPTRFHPRDREEYRRAVGRLGVPMDRPIVLHVGTEHPRKNLPGLLRAFARVHNQDAILVRVGAPRYPQRRELERIVRDLRIEHRVRFLDGVSDEDLALLYCAADLLCLPSFHEGFGLPPLESMASGTPVAVARTASVSEVVGEAGLYFDPRDEASIAFSMEKMLSDANLRDELRAKGLARAKEFPWSRTVDAVTAAYERSVALG